MLAPVKVAVFPLQKNKEELTSTAKGIHKRLQRLMVSQYDEIGAIGRRYRRQDEIGTPLLRHRRLPDAGGPDCHSARARQNDARAHRHRCTPCLLAGARHLAIDRLCANNCISEVRPVVDPQSGPINRASTPPGWHSGLQPQASLMCRGAIYKPDHKPGPNN